LIPSISSIKLKKIKKILNHYDSCSSSNTESYKTVEDSDQDEKVERKQDEFAFSRSSLNYEKNANSNIFNVIVCLKLIIALFSYIYN
jgi:hypothetical protein